MKILLLKDVYKLGRAGDVKKVANGFGRNYLIPQGFAVIATPGAMKQADRIREAANTRRSQLNQELSGDAGKLTDQILVFAARASETGRLYGSVTTRMVAEEIKNNTGVEVNHRQIEMEPLRTLGRYTVPVRLTLDLAPTITVIVHREGETPNLAGDEEDEVAEVEEVVVEEDVTEPIAEMVEEAAEETETAEPEAETSAT